MVQGCLIASRDDDTRAFFRKREGRRQTDPAIAAGDEGDFPCEFLRHSPFPSIIVGSWEKIQQFHWANTIL